MTMIRTVVASLGGAAILCAAVPAAGQESGRLPRLPATLGEAPAPGAGGRGGGDFECLLEPKAVVNVGSPVDGVIEEVTVERGDSVKAGQVVARLQADVEAAAVELRKARAEFGARKLQRNEELYRKKLISAHEKDELDTEARMTELELKKDIEALKLRTVLSPLDGVVVERFLSAGELVRQDKVKILKLAQLDPLNVEVVVPANLFGSIRIGMTGEVSLPAPLRGTHKAKVIIVDRVIDAASGTFGVRLELPNPDAKLPSGVRCRVRFGR